MCIRRYASRIVAGLVQCVIFMSCTPGRRIPKLFSHRLPTQSSRCIESKDPKGSTVVDTIFTSFPNDYHTFFLLTRSNLPKIVLPNPDFPSNFRSRLRGCNVPETLITDWHAEIKHTVSLLTSRRSLNHHGSTPSSSSRLPSPCA